MVCSNEKNNVMINSRIMLLIWKQVAVMCGVSGRLPRAVAGPESSSRRLPPDSEALNTTRFDPLSLSGSSVPGISFHLTHLQHLVKQMEDSTHPL